MEKKIVPCYEVDCVIDFSLLAQALEKDAEELFYDLFSDYDYDYNNFQYGQYMIVDCYDREYHSNLDEIREAWCEVRLYIEDLGYRFYDRVMVVF